MGKGLRLQHCDYVPGAAFHTQAAASAFLRIYSGTAVFHRDSSLGAGFHAFGTANAAHLAHVHHSLALVTVVAAHHSLLLYRRQGNKPFGAGRHAFAAGFAQGGVNFRHAVAHLYRAIVTGFHAVAQAHASKKATAGAACQRNAGWLRNR